MARKRRDKAVVGEKSSEYQGFEDFAKKVLSVPKAELDKREAEAQRTKRTQPA